MSGSENANSAMPVAPVNQSIRSQTSEMRIGNVTYIVNTIFNENGRETAEQKLVRYVADRILNDYKSLPHDETQT
jgi:hypothetical protein